jgi:hypothetical protein
MLIQRNTYYRRIGGYALFYARRAILRGAIFGMDRLHPQKGGGGEVPGQAASLLAKTVPALQHHCSLRSGSMSQAYFPINLSAIHSIGMICPAIHVRPLRGLSTLIALTPGRSVPGGRATRRPPGTSTTWGHSLCDPSGVSAK